MTLDDLSIVKTYDSPSLFAATAAVTVSGGVYPGSNFNIGLQSLPGIGIWTSELTITGGAVVTSGDGQIGLQGAIEADNSLVRLDPGVQLMAPGAPVQGTVTLRKEPIAFLELPGELRSGSGFNVRTHGVSQDVVYTFLDLPGPAVVTPFGPLWVRPTSPLFDVVTIPAASTSAVSSYVTPPLPAALPVVLQPIRLGRAGDVTLGAASRVFIN